MNSKPKKMLILAITFISILACNIIPIPGIGVNETPTATSDVRSGFPTTFANPPTSLPPQTTNIIPTTKSVSPISAGLWRFESDPNVVNGEKKYYAYVWLTAQNNSVVLKHSFTPGIKSDDYGLCSKCEKCSDNPYLETKQGKKYPSVESGCYFAMDDSKEDMTLLPGIPVKGKQAIFGPTGFFYYFSVPYKEEPKEMVLPGISAIIPLPDIQSAIFEKNIPDPSLNHINEFNKLVKLNDTFDVTLQDVNISDLPSNLYLAIARVKIINHDPKSSFFFDIRRSLLGDNGYYWQNVEPKGVLIQNLIDPQLCPYMDRVLSNPKVSIPAAGEITASFCFVIGKEQKILQKISVDLPKSMFFFMTLDDVTVTFKGLPGKK